MTTASARTSAPGTTGATTGPPGLTTTDVLLRLERDGANVLPEPVHENPWAMFARQLSHLLALLLWVGMRTGHNFFKFVFGKTFGYTEEGWTKLTRNVALFFLATAIVNEAVRLGFAHAHIVALNRVFTGIDIWILFKIFIIMPVTGVFFWWQVRLLQKYRLPEPVAARDSA